MDCTTLACGGGPGPDGSDDGGKMVRWEPYMIGEKDMP